MTHIMAIAKSLDLTPCHYVCWFWTKGKYTDKSQNYLVSCNDKCELYYLQLMLSASCRKRVCVYVVAESCTKCWVLRGFPVLNCSEWILKQFTNFGPPLWSSGQSFWLQIQRSRVRFPALRDFLSSSGSGTGSTQPREVN